MKIKLLFILVILSSCGELPLVDQGPKYKKLSISPNKYVSDLTTDQGYSLKGWALMSRKKADSATIDFEIAVLNNDDSRPDKSQTPIYIDSCYILIKNKKETINSLESIKKDTTTLKSIHQGKLSLSFMVKLSELENDTFEKRLIVKGVKIANGPPKQIDIVAYFSL